RIQRRERRVATVRENLMKFGGSLRASSKFQIRLTAQVLRPEFGGGFITLGCFQLRNGQRRLPALQFQRRGRHTSPEFVEQCVSRIKFRQFVHEQLRLFYFAAQRESERRARQ